MGLLQRVGGSVVVARSANDHGRRTEFLVAAAAVGVLLAMALAAGPAAGAYSLQRVPLPAGARGGDLVGVACASASACTAVGTWRTKSDGSRALIEGWNGRRWSLERAPRNRRGWTDVSLAAVSCWSSGGCVAVGEAGNVRGCQMTLVERSNRGHWSVQGTPATWMCPQSAPGGGVVSTAASLSGVSCTSPRACLAVGDLADSGQGLARDARARIATGFEDDQALVERWNGRRWAVLSDGFEGVPLTAVSCAARFACAAASGVGASLPSAQLGQWNGRAWTIATVDGDFTGISCARAAACTSVGFSGDVPDNARPLLGRWNGRRWSVAPGPAPSRRASAALTAVSCVSRSDCTAVGYYGNDSASTGYVERWSGHTWVRQAIPKPSGSRSVELDGISCRPGTACMIVGHATRYGNDQPLAESTVPDIDDIRR